MNFLFTLLFTLSSSLYGAEDSIKDCHHGHAFDKYLEEGCGEHHHHHNAIRFHSASNFQVRRAKCRKENLTFQQMYKFVDEKFTNNRPETNEEINGITLVGEDPKLLKHFKELLETREKYSFEDVIPEKQIDFQTKFKINPECKKVVCAVKKIFGEKYGASILYLKTNYGLNASHYTREKAKEFSPSQMKDVLKAMGDFPSWMFPIKENKQFIRYKDSGGTRVLANASMSYFNLWGRMNRYERQSTVTHELGHYIASSLDLDSTPEWLSFSKWEKDGDSWKLGDKRKSISKYGRTNPHEDFAESIVAYRYNPKGLKKVSTEKYDFIKRNVFLGEEFVDQSNCPGDFPSELLSAVEDPKYKIINRPVYAREIHNREDFFKGCEKIIYNLYANQERNGKELENCVVKNIAISQAREILSRGGKQGVPKNTYIVLDLPFSGLETPDSFNWVIDRSLASLKMDTINTLMDGVNGRKRYIDENSSAEQVRAGCKQLVKMYFYYPFKQVEWKSFRKENIFEDGPESKLGNKIYQTCISKRFVGLNEEVINEIFKSVPHMGKKSRLRYQIEIDALKNEYAKKKEDHSLLPYWVQTSKYFEWKEVRSIYEQRIRKLEAKLNVPDTSD